MKDIYDTVRDGRLMDTPDRKRNEYNYYSSFGSNRHHHHHHHHRYRRNDKGYFPGEFKKLKPPTFDGDLKKMEAAEASILGMNKLFELHEYIDNMKARVAIFCFKGKAYIWWEYVKWVRDITIDDLSWWEFKRLFR